MTFYKRWYPSRKKKKNLYKSKTTKYFCHQNKLPDYFVRINTHSNVKEKRKEKNETGAAPKVVNLYLFTLKEHDLWLNIGLTEKCTEKSEFTTKLCVVFVVCRLFY